MKRPHSPEMKERILRILYTLLQLTWGLPQTLLGALLFLRYRKCRHRIYKGAVWTGWPKRSGVSLGLFIFSKAPVVEEELWLMRHEYGHTLQSLMLGPLYLLVIGIPSFFWANLPFIRKAVREGRLKESALYTEAWANRLGRA